jgi:multidrug efflux pump subunit AcrA (membrane-fusion protein)
VRSIPAAALYDRADGSVVYTALNKDTGKPESPVPVEVGVSDGERVEILSGLTEGQTVWYTVYDTPEYSVPAAV